MKITDKDLGVKVWNFEYGWGVITRISARREYPVSVLFDIGVSREFSLCGRRIYELNQSLFWNEVKFKIPSKRKKK